MYIVSKYLYGTHMDSAVISSTLPTHPDAFADCVGEARLCGKSEKEAEG